MPIKKRVVALFEVLIALSLTAILLTFLFSFFAESAKIENQLDSARRAILARSMIQTRLQNIFTNLDRSTSEPACFYTKKFEKEPQESLIAIFDNGIDPDPAFSGSIMGRLMIDEKGNLVIATWPLGKKKCPPWRTEVLLPKVDRVQFEFLNTDSKEKIWNPSLPKSQLATPSMVRLSIYEREQKKPLHFAFHLPTPVPMVTYTETKL